MTARAAILRIDEILKADVYAEGRSACAFLLLSGFLLAGLLLSESLLLRFP